VRGRRTLRGHPGGLPARAAGARGPGVPRHAGRARGPALRRAGGAGIELATGRWLLNPGSVGQPRDGDPDAAWLLLDFAQVPASMFTPMFS